ncbi:MAG TPA: HEAT repeat domain-containing protein [Anaerolineales bacterium]|nr:HEAT repeat domain-containing protein [Anaerolineales bacterium]
MAKIEIFFETLIADLHGSDWTKRCDAARLLGQSKDPRALDTLLPDLKDDNWKVRRNAAQALGMLKSEKAVGGLLEALKDRTATVRQRAAVALGRIKDPETIPALIEAVIERKELNRFAINEGAYNAVRKFGKKAGPALMEAMKVDQNIYYAQLLADSKYDVGVDFLIELAGSSDLHMRRTALTALGKRNEPRVIEFLLGLFESDDLETQTLAIQALGSLKAVDTAPKLLDLLQGDQLWGPRAGIHRAVCDAFQEFSGIKKDIENAFPVDSKPVFNVGGAPTNIAEMMGMLGNDGFQKLNQFLSDMESRAGDMSKGLNLPPEAAQHMMDQTWKFGAMFADGRDAKDEQLKLLIELLNSESPLTRTATALSLPWYADAQVLEHLERAMDDEDEWVRRAVQWASSVLREMFQ